MRSMITTFAVSLPLLLAAGAVSAADPAMATATDSKAMLAPADKMFFTKAAISGMTEVKAGKMAEDKGTTDEIKTFGKRMEDDHTMANDKLKALASSKSVMLPTDLDAEHKATVAKLDKAKGKSFDTAYVAAMKKGHADTIALFEKASMSKDADIAAFAKETLPTLKDHAATIPSASMHAAM